LSQKIFSNEFGSSIPSNQTEMNPLAGSLLNDMMDPMGVMGQSAAAWEQEYLKEKTAHDLAEEAAKGGNLLGMVDEPKAKFGHGEATLRATQAETGSALMDFFVDPTDLFASERHPALKEVLRVLAKSKNQRGTCFCEISRFLDSS
jgi:hypothetical protein